MQPAFSSEVGWRGGDTPGRRPRRMVNPGSTTWVQGPPCCPQLRLPLCSPARRPLLRVVAECPSVSAPGVKRGARVKAPFAGCDYATPSAARRRETVRLVVASWAAMSRMELPRAATRRTTSCCSTAVRSSASAGGVDAAVRRPGDNVDAYAEDARGRIRADPLRRWRAAAVVGQLADVADGDSGELRDALDADPGRAQSGDVLVYGAGVGVRLPAAVGPFAGGGAAGRGVGGGAVCAAAAVPDASGAGSVLVASLRVGAPARVTAARRASPWWSGVTDTLRDTRPRSVIGEERR
jgi:hypothetical protein